jgi:hypothetical protein
MKFAQSEQLDLALLAASYNTAANRAAKLRFDEFFVFHDIV